MSPLKFIWLLLLISMNALLVRGQPTEGRRALPSFDDSVPITEIVRETESLPPNDSKVMKYLAIAHTFLNHGRGKNLDTCLVYLQQAYAIGTAIHDTVGINETLSWLCDLYMNKGDITSAVALLPLTYGEERVSLLLIIGEGYVSLEPVEIPLLEKAAPFLSQAMRLADSLGSRRWQYECLMLRAKYFFEHGNTDKGRDAILTIIKSCDSLKDYKGEGNYWSEMNTYMPVTSQTVAYHLFANRQCIHAYELAGDRHGSLYALRDLAENNQYVGELDSAESEFMVFLGETEKLGITPSPNTNYQVGSLYLHKGDMDKALDYTLRALNTLGADVNQWARRIDIYRQLAFIYQQTDVPGEELNYGRLAVETACRFNQRNRHYYSTFVIDALVKTGQPQHALAYLQEFNAANPVRSPEQQEAIAYDYGLVYDALGVYTRADYWFQQLTGLETAAQQESSSTIFDNTSLLPFLVHLYTGRFYVRWGKYQQATPFLQKALTDPKLDRNSSVESEFQLLLYKTDSAAGDLRSALGHYLRHTAIDDSIFNVRKMRQFQTLEVQYQTKQREQSILLLKSEGERQRAQLSKASFVRKITFAGIILLLILAAWAYYAYRAKRRNVNRLLIQQVEINEKNLALEHLVGEKNELLAEKNLLLQEVHHRVKNNLHTVMSLLESQSAYLSDRAARNVLLDSQNRIHTISLLHQKLYWSSNVTSLEMAPYIAELSSFLASSLGARERRIVISQSIDAITLDISLALPIGLLLNEAITNALKHAFPGNTDQHAERPGHIDVSMRRLPEGQVSLQINDDGVGMPCLGGSDAHSLGMILMKSIGQKLGGRFAIRSGAEGVRVQLEFTL